MAQTHQRLTTLSIAKKVAPGYYADGAGLYLQVTSAGAKSWIYRYMLARRRREMGLGALSDVSLAQARAKAIAARQLVKTGQDPIDARDAEKARQRLEAARSTSFDEAARLYIADHEGAWRNAVHRQQWKTTLITYVSPKIGTLSVAAIGTPEVTKVLDPIWQAKPETASRIRGRIELILDWAKARGYRTGENPARWRGHLDKVYPKRSKLRKVQHLAAVAIDDLATVYANLCEKKGMAALAARFTILTAVRVSVTTGAMSTELKPDMWSISSERMKAERDHNVPLSSEAKAVLKLAREFQTDARVFPGRRAGRGVSKAVVLKAFRTAGAADATVHGCRSTFKDWAMERTNFPAEVSEMALAHAIGDKTEAAYRRGELVKKRAAMMEAWAGFLLKPPSVNVVQIGRRRA
jgi:integrase